MSVGGLTGAVLSNHVHSAVAKQDDESIIMMHGSPEPTEVDIAIGLAP